MCNIKMRENQKFWTELVSIFRCTRYVPEMGLDFSFLASRFFFLHMTMHSAHNCTSKYFMIPSNVFTMTQCVKYYLSSRRRNPARVVKYDYNYIAMYVVRMRTQQVVVGNVKAAASYFYEYSSTTFQPLEIQSKMRHLRHFKKRVFQVTMKFYFCF